MTRLNSIIIFLMLIWTGGCDSLPKSKAKQFKVNGLNVIIKELPESDIVSAGFYLKGGVAYIPEEQAGIEQLLLSVMPKGSEKYDKELLQGLTESIGTSIAGSGGRDYSTLTLQCLVDQFDQSWDIFQDVILHPRLDSIEIELERVNQLTNIRAESDNPDTYLQKLAREFYYQRHPYEQSPLGTEESISTLTRDDLLNYYKDNIKKSRALLVMVGGITKQDILNIANDLAKALPKGNSYKDRLPEHWSKNSSGMRVIKGDSDMPTNYLIGQANAPNKMSEDYYPFLLASRKLGTRVFEEVRTKRNLSYAPAAGYSTGRSSYTYLYVTTTKPDTTIKVMYQELDKLKETPLTEKEVKELRMMFLTRHYMSKETVAAQRDVLANYELTGPGYRYAEIFMKKVQSVTAEDIQRVAKTYLTNYQFTYLGDPNAVNEDVFLSYSWPTNRWENK